MRNLKNVLLLAAIMCGAILIPGNNIAVYSFACITAIVFAFNLCVRRSLYFKPYFLSKFNIFSAKSGSRFEVDIPVDLAFEKIKEVIADSSLKLIKADRNKREILAISNISFSSWGENIYFSFEEIGNRTIVKFDSAALFQIYTWGKNETNYKVFSDKLEQSFTI